MSGSRTVTEDDDQLDNIHPGEILREDFLIGSEGPLAEVASGSGVDVARLQQILDEKLPIDAHTGLRLARYFGMSEDFFLQLQIDFDLENERHAHGADLDRIVKRAA
jgi:addiction module HigA family antidote